MPDDGTVVVIGGTRGIGREVARHYADLGREVVLAGRDPDRCKTVAEEVGGRARGLALDLSRPEELADRLADVGQVDHLVLAAIDRDDNLARDYNLAGAARLITLKLIGCTEVVHTLLDRMGERSSVVIFGGRAKDTPYVGSTTVSTVNAGVTGLIRALAVELAPIRFNALHPGFVEDTPQWSDKPAVLDAVRARTPGGRLATMRDVVGAVAFLLENPAVNGVDLYVDGGWMLL